MYRLVMGLTIRISNRILDVRFGSKFELCVKKNRTELSSIFYCSKIELENIFRSRLKGHNSLKPNICTFLQKLFLKNKN
jgi:hypothetical protein